MTLYRFFYIQINTFVDLQFTIFISKNITTLQKDGLNLKKLFIVIKFNVSWNGRGKFHWFIPLHYALKLRIRHDDNKNVHIYYAVADVIWFCVRIYPEPI